MSKNTLLVIGLIVLVVVVAAMLMSRGKSDTNTTATSQPTSATQQASPAASSSATSTPSIVVYGATGFTPATHKIKVGDTVTFQNASVGAMWVASDPHPFHTDYAEFDSKQSLEQGKEFVFTFTKKGTWKHHNHLNPSHTGSIVVE